MCKEYATYTSILFWFMLLLVTPTMQFSLDCKRRSHKQNQCWIRIRIVRSFIAGKLWLKTHLTCDRAKFSALGEGLPLDLFSWAPDGAQMQDNRRNIDLKVCLYWPDFLTLPLDGLRGPCSLRNRLKNGRGSGEFPSYSHSRPSSRPPTQR